jgi:hypothetical protein
MRPKFVLTVCLAALLVAGAAIYFKPQRNPLAGPATGTETTALPATSVANPPRAALPPMTFPAPPVSVAPLTPEQRQLAIEAETDRLEELSMSDNPADLTPILADLASPEKEIRDAAIEATKQFGSPDAIPALQAAAANTSDPEEKADLLEAADFLALPDVSDLVTPGAPATAQQIQADEQRRNQRPHSHVPQSLPTSPAPDQNSPAAPGN